MKEKRRLEFFLETHEITTISFRRGFPTTVFCRLCQTETLHLRISQAASVLKFSEFKIFRLVQDGQIHSAENAAGQLLLCGNSLSALAQNSLAEN
jgi:hypothetical protein